MTNILKSLAVALILAVTAVSVSGPAFAGQDNYGPFYPDQFKSKGK